MSTIAELRLPAGEFALSETFEAVPDAEFEIERVVAHEADRLMPYVWVTTEETSQAALDDALADDGTVENESELATFEDEWFYRMEWTEQIRVVLHIMLEHDGTVLNAAGHDDEWHFRILFPSRDSLSATYDFCQREDLTLDVARIYRIDSDSRDRYALTDTQHETLVTAVEEGYYDIPQESTLDDLASEFGVSHQALSERLHRASKTLIENTLRIGRMKE